VNPLLRDLSRYMVGVERVDDRVVARFRLPAEFVGFQGHFPGRPVLPAVCEIMAVVAVWQAWTGRAVTVDEVVSAKFPASVFPDQTFAVECVELVDGRDGENLKAAIECDGKRVAQVVLRVVVGGRVECEP